MRSEKEVLDAVLRVAAADDAVKAVIRTNLVPKRKYDYYNFCFVVTDIERFDGDVFATCFGDRILLYRGDRNYPELFPNKTKAHLMVFRDGVTIVINAMDKDAFLARYYGEPNHENVWIGDTYLKILDKDGMLPVIERLSEKQTWFAQKPSEEEFHETCNEFWWVLKTFAEYTLRKELPSAMFYLNVAVRDLLNRLIRWDLFLRAGQSVDMGILDCNMEKLLDEDRFGLYKKTYPTADYENIREAFHAVVKLWSITAGEVAAHCGYDYAKETEADMLRFISDLAEQ
ncbi:MAG: aminoglycoside 6-adenylyltransferase [Lachnospiraceae bacterium]|nr:aminoglycoside 6-adenylyltransferase [Lachnospiraceae bacterium]